MRVTFFAPSADLVRSAPASAADYWPWIAPAVKAAPAQLGDGRGACTWLGPYNWTVQTFLELRASGVDCELAATLPDEGIIISHGDFLPPAIAASSQQFIVEIKPDRALQCRFANHVVTQNGADPLCQWPLALFVHATALPYWPQPGLIVRDESRGDRFENIWFMGRQHNLLGADDIAAGLRARGLNWIVKPIEQWHDYSQLDAVVAVRPEADRSRPGAAAVDSANRKPASKLVNAWLAGVPSILSPDDAFLALRTSPLDFLEAASAAAVLEHVDALRSNPELRRAMAQHGRTRGTAFSRRRVTERWAALIADTLVPQAEHWRRASVRRAAFFASRTLAHAVRWRVERRRAASAQATSGRPSL